MGLLQAALLPAVPAEAPVSVAYRPADGATAGGDFYDAFTLADGRTGIILGDVSGHGRDALARTTFVRYTLRAYLEAGLEPREVLKVGAAALADHLDGGFATVMVALHDAASGRFTYASAGHPPPLVAGGAGRFEAVTACSAPPLGIDEPTGFRQTTFTLTAGSRACLHTDGVVEARVNGRLLGVGRLEHAARVHCRADADAEQLLDAVGEMADEIPDDMAVCLITAALDAPVAGPRIEELEVDEHEVGDSLERFLRACGVPLVEVPGILREAGEAARREGSATVRVRLGSFRPGVDVRAGQPRAARGAPRRSPLRVGSPRVHRGASARHDPGPRWPARRAAAQGARRLAPLHAVRRTPLLDLRRLQGGGHRDRRHAARAVRRVRRRGMGEGHAHAGRLRADRRARESRTA